MIFEITGKHSEEGVSSYSQHTITEKIDTKWRPEIMRGGREYISDDDMFRDVEEARRIFKKNNPGYYIYSGPRFLGVK
jgi:hypothetical protein